MKKRRNGRTAPAVLAGILCVLLSVPACAAAQSSKKAEPLEIITGKAYKNEYTEEDYTTLLDIQYPAVFLTEEEEKSYPLLKEAFDAMNEEKRVQMEEEFDDWRDSALSMYEDVPEYFYGFFDRSELIVVRADTAVVSLTEPWYSYSGGAHGMYGRGSYMFDPETGELLQLKDISPDPQALMDEILKQVKARYPGLSFMDEGLFEIGNEKDFSFALTNEGLDVYIMPYLLASYAEGAQNVLIPFAGNEALFEEQYRSTPDVYIQGLVADTASLLDADNDGVPEEVMVWGEMDEYQTYSTLHIVVDGNDFTEDCFCYGFTPLYMHTEQGNYLYVQQLLDNDYRKLYIYRIDTPEISCVTDLEAGFYMPQDYESGYTKSLLPSNPAEFLLESRTDALSTSSTYRRYTIGPDGLPQPLDEMWTIMNPRDLTLLTDLKADRIDENGRVLEKNESLPAGTVLGTYRTDDERYVDLLTKEGEIVRLEVTLDSWPMKVDGREADTVFDGMMFAG